MTTDYLSHLTTEEKAAIEAQFQSKITKDLQKRLGQAAIAKQFIPDRAELLITPQERNDPLAEQKDAISASAIHRYRNRLLWKVSARCANYCRFCFRKMMIAGHGKAIDDEEIKRVHQYLAAHSEIDEVILSGGDPLMLAPMQLEKIVLPLKDMPDIKRIRVHTRMPILSYERLDMRYFDILDKAQKNVVVVLHINHSDEFSAGSDALLSKLRQRYLLLSQSVLLKGVNDNALVLKRLFDDLLARHIHPYYLHHMDMAAGTGHFRLSLKEGRAIYRELQNISSGIGLAHYMIELPNGMKQAVMSLSDEAIAELDRVRGDK